MLFVLPFAVVFVAFALAPLVYALYTSGFVDKLIGGTTFSGVSNYRKIFGDATFWSGVRRVLEFGVVEVPVMLVLAGGLALAMDLGLIRGAKYLRLVYFLPFAIPGVVATITWGFMYEPTFGPFATLAHWTGLPTPGFLTSGGLLPSIGNIVVWETLGFNLLIIYSALQAVPESLTEAAVLDGASVWGIVRHIKIPAIASSLGFTALLGVIGTLQLFTEPEILSAFSPLITSGYTPNIDLYTTGFIAQNQDLAAAMSFILGFIIVFAASVILLLSRRRSRRRWAQ